MTLAVFRADASPTLGGGHVMRCLALADRLEREGWETAFACSPETPQVVPFLAKSNHPVLEISDDDADPLFRHWSNGTDWLVVDHYGLDAAFESRCRPWARRILVIDDLANRRHDGDLLLDPTCGRRVSAYRGLTPHACWVLAGAAYMPLRPQFAQWREKRLVQGTRPGDRILVSMGLSDSGSTIRRVLDGIKATDLNAVVAVVAGARERELEALREIARRSSLRISVHNQVEDMARLMATCNLAFGAGGMSSWERCVLGLPALIVITADNQRSVARALAEAGAAAVIGDADSVTAESVAKAFKETMERPQRLMEMSRRAMAVCDGLGAGRVAMEMAPETVHTGERVWLRPATMADSDLIFEWQSDFFTRRYFNTPEAPARDEHLEWMAATVTNPGRHLNVIMHGDVPVGALRLDLRTGTNGEWKKSERAGTLHDVSIFVAREHTGLGIGTAALRSARRLIPWAHFVADVHAENAASHALFRAAGYHFEDGRYVCQPNASR